VTSDAAGTVPDMPVPTVYERRWCHLCNDMVAALEPLRAEFGLALEVVDVDGDPGLAARYGERITVLADGESELHR
jgi:glutaredoxin